MPPGAMTQHAGRSFEIELYGRTTARGPHATALSIAPVQAHER